MASDFSVPYHEEIPHFKLPTKIQLSGVVQPNAKRFEVDLIANDGEFYLHFNPRFAEDCVVRSSTKDGQNWQTEERDGGMPFALGKPFTIDLTVENEAISCSVNGSPFCEFQARDDLTQLSALHVDGDVQLRSVSVVSVGTGTAAPPSSQKPVREAGEEEGEVGLLEPEPQPAVPPVVQPVVQPARPQPQPVPQQPAKQPTPPKPAAPPAQPSQPQTVPQRPANPPPQGKLPVPYQAPLESLVKTNRMRVVAIPHPNAQRFTVNWKTADGETLFHFNPRFDQNCVVRNASVNKQYPADGEERAGGACPFQPGKLFALDFLVHGSTVMCFVDGVEFCRFQLRGDFRQVATLDIHGDVALQDVLIA